MALATSRLYALCAVAVAVAVALLALALTTVWPHRASAAQAAPVTTAAPVSTPDPQQLLDTILADPGLQRRPAAPTPPALPTLPVLNLPSIDLSFLPVVLIVMGALAAFILVILLGPMLFRYFMKVRLRHDANLADGVEVTTSGEAIQRAQDATAAQNYRLALRLLYLASLLKLDEIGALRYDRALTNREYVRQVTLKPALASALQPVVETFDDVWYGVRPVTPEGYAAFTADVNRLMRAAEETGD